MIQTSQSAISKPVRAKEFDKPFEENRDLSMQKLLEDGVSHSEVPRDAPDELLRIQCSGERWRRFSGIAQPEIVRRTRCSHRRHDSTREALQARNFSP